MTKLFAKSFSVILAAKSAPESCSKYLCAEPAPAEAITTFHFKLNLFRNSVITAVKSPRKPSSTRAFKSTTSKFCSSSTWPINGLTCHHLRSFFNAFFSTSTKSLNPPRATSCGIFPPKDALIHAALRNSSDVFKTSAALDLTFSASLIKTTLFLGNKSVNICSLPTGSNSSFKNGS